VSTGLIASETNRRASLYLSNPPAKGLRRWKKGVLTLVNRSPRSAALFQKVHGWLR
jgi:hypothetical protein